MPFYHKAGSWQEVVQGTGGKKAVARYIHTLTPPQIHQLEFDCVDPEREDRADHEVLPRPKPHVRAFWMDVGTVIGASKGEETTLIRVEVTSGRYHGRPITEAELVEELAQ
jgi:hypothetical protein